MGSLVCVRERRGRERTSFEVVSHFLGVRVVEPVEFLVEDLVLYTARGLV